ncbi:hypothetical protein Tco_0968951 [Tanacetum coccineum]
MADKRVSLLEELSRAANSSDIKSQLVVLFRREVVEDSEKMENYHRLSNELEDGVNIRDGYINELQMCDVSNEVFESIQITKRMQLDDMEKASRLMLMAREVQNKVYEKNSFIRKLRGYGV